MKMFPKKYLLYFANDYHPFRVPEIEALCSLYNIKPTWIEAISDKPYAIVENVSDDQIKNILSRSVLLKSGYELWANASSRCELFEQIKQSTFVNFPENVSAQKSFKILVESFNKKLTKKIQIEKIEELDFLPFEGPIKLTDPDNVFALFEYYGPNANHAPDEPLHLYFGKFIQEGQRRLMHAMSLKGRKFLSNTTMEPTLSLLMSNITKIENGHLVFDPFVGSGSLLVAAAYHGGFVFGTDIDYKLLHGLSRPTRAYVKQREENETIFENLKQYSLQDKYIDVVAGDSSNMSFHEKLVLDAIICDPPYGIRESSLQTGSDKPNCQVPEECLAIHIPQKVHYNLGTLVNNLLNFCAKHLKLNGRVAFWMPIFKDVHFHPVESTPNPCHPCFKLISTSEQELSAITSRVLVCMEKCKEIMECDVNYTAEDNLNDARSFRERFYKSVKVRIEEKKSNKKKHL